MGLLMLLTLTDSYRDTRNSKGISIFAIGIKLFLNFIINFVINYFFIKCLINGHFLHVLRPIIKST